MTEQRRWRPVVGFEGFYEVSDDGLVMSLNYRGNGKPALLKIKPDSHVGGYMRCNIRNGDGNRSLLVHRMVAEAFLGPPPHPSKWTVNHKDGVRTNNRIENLEWASPKDQAQHAIEILGKNQRGENCGLAKLTNEQALEIAQRCRRETRESLANEFGITSASVYGIMTGQRWSSVTGIEPFRVGKHGQAKLSHEDVAEMRRRRAAGEKLGPIAADFGVTKATASRAVNGKTWRDVETTPAMEQGTSQFLLWGDLCLFCNADKGLQTIDYRRPATGAGGELREEWGGAPEEL